MVENRETVNAELVKSFYPDKTAMAIASRYQFKQQVSQDVISTLKEYAEVPVSEGPLEQYLDAMKQKIVMRLKKLNEEEVNTLSLSYQEKLAWLEYEQTKLEKESQQVKSAVVAARNKLTSQKQAALEQTNKYQNQVDDLEGRLTSVAQEVSKHTENAQQFRELTLESARAVATIQEKLEDATTAHAKNQGIIHKAAEEEQALQEKVQSLEEELHQGKQSTQGNEQSLQNLWAKVHEIQLQLEEEKLKKNRLKETCERLEMDCKAMSTQGKSLAEVLKTNAKEAEEAAKQRAALEVLKEELVAEAVQRQQVVAELQDTYDEAARAEKANLEKNQKLKAELRHLKEQIEQGQLRQSQATRELKSLKASTLETQHNNAVLRHQKEQLEEQNAKLQEQIDATTSEIDFLEIQNTSLDQELQGMKADVVTQQYEKAQRMQMRNMQDIQAEIGTQMDEDTLPKVQALDQLKVEIAEAHGSLESIIKFKVDSMSKMGDTIDASIDFPATDSEEEEESAPVPPSPHVKKQVNGEEGEVIQNQNQAQNV